jgi:hypothetical protein
MMSCSPTLAMPLISEGLRQPVTSGVARSTLRDYQDFRHSVDGEPNAPPGSSGNSPGQNLTGGIGRAELRKQTQYDAVQSVLLNYAGIRQVVDRLPAGKLRPPPTVRLSRLAQRLVRHR